MKVKELIDLTEMILMLNQPEPNPAETIEHDGLSYQRQHQRQGTGDLWFVFNQKIPIGAFITDEHQYEPTMSIHPEVEPEFRRQGFGMRIYKFAELLANRKGKQLVPSDSGQTDAAKALWKKRLK